MFQQFNKSFRYVPTFLLTLSKVLQTYNCDNIFALTKMKYWPFTGPMLYAFLYIHEAHMVSNAKINTKHTLQQGS